MTPTGHLSRLIRDLFSAESIRQFIAEYFDFEDDIDFNRSLRSIAIKVAGHVWDAGMEEAFLDAVAEERPDRDDEIEATRRRLAQGRRAERSNDGLATQGLLGVDRTALDYETAELTFGESTSVWSVRSAGANAEAEPAVLELDAPPAATRSLSGPTRDAGADGGAGADPGQIPPDVDEVGRHLWTAIFSPEGANLGAGLPKIQPQTGGRRIVLDLTGAPGLASYPWECIRRPGRPPMGVDVKSTVIRLIDADEYVPADLKIPQPPLRLLVVAADSQRRDDFDFATEVARIGNTANLVIPDPLVDATFESLFKALRDQRPHILHFIGHGSARGIELMGNGSATELLDASALANLVGNNLQTLRLVFLNSCRGAEETDALSFTGAASQMVQAGLPAAVAMQYPISNEAAIELSEIFYSYVALGDEIDAAITQARSYLHGMGHAEWMAPALYVRRWQDSLALVDQTPAGVPAQPVPVVVDEPAGFEHAVDAAPPAAPAPAAGPTRGAEPPEEEQTDGVVVPIGGRKIPLAVILTAAALPLLLVAILSIGFLGSTFDNVFDGTDDVLGAPASTVPTTTPISPTTTPTTAPPQTGDSAIGVVDVEVPVDEASVVIAHGLPGEAVDVYIDGDLVIADFEAGETAGSVDLPPGTYPIEVYEDSAAAPDRSTDRDDQPVVTDEIVIGEQAATVIVGVDDDGDPAIESFEPDISAVEAGRGRIEFRHLGTGGAVEFTVNGDALGQPIEPGGSATITTESGELTIVAAPVGGADPVETTVTVAGGDLIVVSAIGSPTDPPTLDLVAQRYGGLPMIPVGVDAGNSGLRAMAAAGRHPARLQLADPSTAPIIGDRQRTSAGPSGTVAPTAVRVNGVQLSAPIIPVGIDENDTVTVPAPDLAGWYRHGSLPGAEGSSTLVAHVDYDGRPAAFYDLENVRVGDEVEVRMSDGSVERFVVTRSTYYHKDDLPVGELFDNTGPSQLHLITCGGDFDIERRSYQGNVVVTATPLGR